jgi:TonB family protein
MCYKALMRFTISLSLLLAAMQSCEPSRQEVEKQARLYFPHAQAVQDRDMMAVYTCTDLGEAAVKELAPIINQKLEQYKGDGFVRNGWETLAIGFEKQVVLINMANKADNTYSIVRTVADPTYSRSYAEKCGQPTAVSSTAPTSNNSPAPPSTAPSGGVFRVGGGVSPPAVLSRVEPRYPDEARKAKCGGTTVAEAIVRKDGTVSILRIARSAGCAGLDDAAIEALKQWRFRPGMKDGMPVDVAINIEINFNLGR